MSVAQKLIDGEMRVHHSGDDHLGDAPIQRQHRARNEDDELRALFPGHEVEIAHGKVVTVYPMGVPHIPQFKSALVRAFVSIAQAGVGIDALENVERSLSMMSKDDSDDASNDATMAAARETIFKLATAAGPIIADELFELLCECVDGIDLRNPHVPHWVLPFIGTAWFKETFGAEKKLRPWVEMADEAMSSITGERVGLWQILSSSLSRRATIASPSSAGTSARDATESSPG